MSEESKSVYMSYIELVRISLDAAQRIGSEIELHHGGLIKLFKEIDALNARIAELEADKERLKSCESALVSMVYQFFYSKAGENIFRHSFMSAEEEAAEYLVEHGIARWAGKNKSAICFDEVQE